MTNKYLEKIASWEKEAGDGTSVIGGTAGGAAIGAGFGAAAGSALKHLSKKSPSKFAPHQNTFLKNTKVRTFAKGWGAVGAGLGAIKGMIDD